MDVKKLKSLEGVRALACIGVVLCHLQGAFFPGSELVALMGRTPLQYLFSGNTPVRIMFVLSGFVLCYKYFSTGKTGSLERDVVKRYFRLAVPTAAVILFVYGMMRLNLLFNAEAATLTNSQNFLGTFNQFEPQLKTALQDGFFGSLFLKSADYVGTVWSMTYEMLGSYFVFALVGLLKNRRARYFFYAAYLFVAVYIFLYPTYYSYFIVGMVICDIYTGEERLNRFLQNHKGLTLSLHVAAWFYITMSGYLDAELWKSILFDAASVVMFLTLLNSSLLERIWGNKAAVTVGKHGFSIYLLHWPIIESFSCFYLLALTRMGFTHKMILMSDIILSTGLIYVVSVFFTKLVVLPSNRLSDWIGGKILG